VLGPGEFSIALRADLPLRIEAGRAALALPVPAAGSVLLTLAIPGDRTNVQLTNGMITSRTSSGGQTTIEATLSPGRVASIWWAARESVAPVAPREVRFLSDVKTLVSVSEAALNLVALVDLTVVQGEPGQFEIEIPAGYGVTGVTGPSLESSDVQPGAVAVKVRSAAVRSHQFLISMEKNIDAAVKADIPFVTVKATQRETGEVLVEGAGSLELAAKESGALKRMDLKETSPYLRSLAHDSLTAAFRYHRQAAETPGLALEWVRFPDAALPPAIAQSATAAGRDHHPFGRRGGREGETGRRPRWPARAAAAPRFPAQGRVHRVVRFPARRHSVRQKGRIGAGSAEDGYAGRFGKLGSVSARPVQSDGLRRERDFHGAGGQRGTGYGGGGRRRGDGRPRTGGVPAICSAVRCHERLSPVRPQPRHARRHRNRSRWRGSPGGAGDGDRRRHRAHAHRANRRERTLGRRRVLIGQAKSERRCRGFQGGSTKRQLQCGGAQVGPNRSARR
jgi:hypothetical protein